MPLDITQVAKLDAAIKANDPKILQMELQGCIGTTVNQGPIEVARVFLRYDDDLFLWLARQVNFEEFKH